LDAFQINTKTTTKNITANNESNELLVFDAPDKTIEESKDFAPQVAHAKITPTDGTVVQESLVDV